VYEWDDVSRDEMAVDDYRRELSVAVADILNRRNAAICFRSNLNYSDVKPCITTAYILSTCVRSNINFVTFAD